MPYVPRVASPRRRTEPKVEEAPTEVHPTDVRPRPDVAKLAAPDVVKTVGTVVHPVSDNPAACPGPVCEECFSDGVDPGSTSVGCSHGMWVLESD